MSKMRVHAVEYGCNLTSELLNPDLAEAVVVRLRQKSVQCYAAQAEAPQEDRRTVKASVVKPGVDNTLLRDNGIAVVTYDGRRYGIPTAIMYDLNIDRVKLPDGRIIKPVGQWIEKSPPVVDLWVPE